MKNLHTQSHLSGHTLVKNNKGVNFCYLNSKVTSTGGGTYLTRALAARNETKADVIVFVLPRSENTVKNVERIKRGREDLMSAVSPLILPFKIVVVVGSQVPYLIDFYKDMNWSDVKY